MGRNEVSGEKIPISQIATYLSKTTRRPVIDKTGLAGKYDIKLEWTPDPGQPDDSGPSIYTALQEQLGLKLVPSTGPVECLVIDHVETPTEN